MPPYRKPAPDAPRRVAFDVLRAVSEHDAYANLVLPGLLRERGLTGRDAGFATELAYGALRGQGTYDAVITACVDRPLAEVDPAVLDILRLGAHQLIGGMRVPPHAAVGATVELARAVVGGGRAGFVNAVLRRMSARDRSGWLDQLAPDRSADPAGHLALVHAHPRWVVEAYADALGADWDEVEAALAADNEAPAVHLVARPGRADRDELALLTGTPGRWSPYSVVSTGGDPARLEQVRSGAVGVQDEGSQLAALAVASAPLEGPDRRWLDLCAGPGGKAVLLAGLADAREARLLAVELAAHRARLVAASLPPVGRALAVQADGTVPAWPAQSFDRVLLDAPCSGLGALRRRPEARWRKQPGDLAGLRRLQAALLDAAVESTRPGGVVGYVTCSPHVAETRAVVAAALRRHAHLEQLDAPAVLPHVAGAGAGRAIQLWPHRHGTDAMFVALLRVGVRPIPS